MNFKEAIIKNHLSGLIVLDKGDLSYKSFFPKCNTRIVNDVAAFCVLLGYCLLGK